MAKTRAAGPVKQNAHCHTVKVSERGAVPSAHQHAGRGSSQVSGVENRVAVNNPKAAGVGEGATRSLAGWLLVYSEAV